MPPATSSLTWSDARRRSDVASERQQPATTVHSHVRAERGEYTERRTADAANVQVKTGLEAAL